MSRHHVVVVGGGFGGLSAVRALRDARVRVTLVDRRNFHLFQPLLYQVATGGLSPANIAAPLRKIFRRQRNVEVWMAEVRDFEPERRLVLTDSGPIPYDTLVLAAGSRPHYFGRTGWATLAPGLKTVEDATEIRSRVLAAFEEAEKERDPRAREAWLTFVVVGGGPTGVELAGALAEVARDTLARDFRRIDPRSSAILLVEGADRILPTFAPCLSEAARRALERLGVRVRTRCFVRDIEPRGVVLESPAGSERIEARTVLWAAGIRASPLAERLSARTGVPLDPMGRVRVEPDLTLRGHPEIFVIGDMACVPGEKGEPLPAMAPVAIQEGRHVARQILRRLRGKKTEPFRYRDRGVMATIGRAAAVADLRWLRFDGFAAWVVWLAVHLLQLVEFENRILVSTQWAWNYFTRNRSARLITGEGLGREGENEPGDRARVASPPR
ncbi:MAG: NADH dehydrogenase [Candidatus Binatia bacterium]|nr:MAG: NADH dehydrogenase [Candidatus Binatia bacterium]